MAEGNGTITAGGFAQQLLGASSIRKGFFVQNNSSANLAVSLQGSTPSAAGPVLIPAGQLFSTPPGMPVPGPVQIWGATTSQAFSWADW